MKYDLHSALDEIRKTTFSDDAGKLLSYNNAFNWIEEQDTLDSKRISELSGKDAQIRDMQKLLEEKEVLNGTLMEYAEEQQSEDIEDANELIALRKQAADDAERIRHLIADKQNLQDHILMFGKANPDLADLMRKSDQYDTLLRQHDELEKCRTNQGHTIALMRERADEHEKKMETAELVAANLRLALVEEARDASSYKDSYAKSNDAYSAAVKTREHALDTVARQEDIIYTQKEEIEGQNIRIETLNQTKKKMSQQIYSLDRKHEQFTRNTGFVTGRSDHTIKNESASPSLSTYGSSTHLNNNKPMSIKLAIHQMKNSLAMQGYNHYRFLDDPAFKWLEEKYG